VTSVGHRRKLLDAIAGLGIAVSTVVAGGAGRWLHRHKSTPNAGS